MTNYYNDYCLYKVASMKATHRGLIVVPRQFFTLYQTVCFLLKNVKLISLGPSLVFCLLQFNI